MTMRKLAEAPRPQAAVLKKTSFQAGSYSDLLLVISAFGDATVVFVGLVTGFWIRFKSGLIPFFGMEDPGLELGDYLNLFIVGNGFLLLAFAYLGLYEQSVLLRFRVVADILVRGTVFWLFAYLGLSLGLKFDPPISRLYVLISFMTCLLGLVAWRFVFHRALLVEFLAGSLRRRVLFVGWTNEADRLLAAMRNDASQPYRPIGYVTPHGGGLAAVPPASIRNLGYYDETAGIIARRETDIVVLAESSMDSGAVFKLVDLCEREYVRFKVIPSYFQILASSLHLETISGVPILGATDLPLNHSFNRALKRSIDVVGALVGLVLSCPILAVLGAWVWIESPGAVVFSQVRVGRGGYGFNMHKLRSMKLGADKTDHLKVSTLRDDPRLLRIGKFMRKWNLDELPQFWNVLKGEMSLVGPRPERSYHSQKLSEEIPHYNARHASKPGMTGWAQVHGLRGDTSLEERVRFDLFYLENWSLWLDFKIMLLTFVRRDNAY